MPKNRPSSTISYVVVNVRNGSIPAVAAAVTPTAASGRKLPSALFIDERLTADVADFKPAVPLPAK